MKVFCSFITAILMLGTIIIQAQDNEYTVLTKSGDVFKIDKLSNNPLELTLGQKLQLHDKIQVAPNGYVVLVDTNLQTVELSTEGLYNVSAIDTIFTIKKNSIGRNITSFILHEMSTSKAKYDEMKTLGAVVRQSGNVIEPALPRESAVLDTSYEFKWHPLPKKTSYIFRMFNDEGKTLYMREVPDTSIQLNLADFNLLNEQEYFWTVSDKESIDQKIDSTSITIISPQNRDKIKRQLKDLKNDFIKKDSPINNLIIAKYLKENGLNELAIEYFKTSALENPDNEFYWFEYIQFLLDQNLHREAIEVWNKSPFNQKPNNYEN